MRNLNFGNSHIIIMKNIPAEEMTCVKALSLECFVDTGCKPKCQEEKIMAWRASIFKIFNGPRTWNSNEI